MVRRLAVFTACTIAAASTLATMADKPLNAAGSGTLTLASARVTLDGTSSLHPYTASTTTVRLVKAEFTGEGLEAALEPGALTAFEVAIPVATLTSPKEGIDKNMHKALGSEKHSDITFRVSTLAAAGSAGAEGLPLRATGALTIAGMTREVTVDLKARQTGAQLTVTGAIDLLMTDYGIKPPKAMLGMLKTDPKVRVSFEVALAAAGS